jgi:F-type H+-transporting ATPase subunit delta
VASDLHDVSGGQGRDIGRADVSEPASISTGIANRYAAALFDLAKEEGALEALEADVEALDTALSGSEDFRILIGSPVIPRWDQERSITAIAKKMGLSGLLGNTLALMAQRRRLFVLPHLMADLRNRIAAEKGEMTAEVVSATVLTKEQSTKLAAMLKARVGKTVKLKTTVDESLIGGLVVKLGSTMIDTSIRSKLAALKNAMKEVG